MAISIERYHQCSHQCFDNRIRYYEDRITQLSGRVYRLTDAIESSQQRIGFREPPPIERNISELRVAMGDAEQIWKQLDGENEGIQEHFETGRKETVMKIEGYSRELGWTMGRFNQLKEDVERLAQRGKDLVNSLYPPEEESRSVHDFAEPNSRSDSPRPYRRRHDSDEDSDSERDERPVEFKPPTYRERAGQQAQEILKAGKKWVRKNRVLTASLALNVILLAMRKFS